MNVEQDRPQSQLIVDEAAASETIWAIFAGYALIMLLFLWRTYREGEAAGGGWDLARAGGLLLSAAWPLLIVLAAIAVVFHSRREDDVPQPVARSSARAGAYEETRISLFGIPVLDQTFEAAVAMTAGMARSQARSTIYFVNAHTLNLASQSPGYSAVLRQADVVFGDGTGVRWAARMRGRRLKANVNGTDLIPALLEREEGLRCFLLGSSAERIGEIGRTFRKRFPQVQLVGSHHGYVDHEMSLAVIGEINRARPDVLLVGMGNPLQEEWIHRYRARLDVPLVVAVGGLFEYWSGMLIRAPRWVRWLGFEWLHILRHQPWKARRYLIGNFEFLWRSLSWRSADLRKREAAT